MGIYDRQYYRDNRGDFARLSGWSVNTWIIVINVAIFIAMALMPGVNQTLRQYGHFSAWTVLYHKVNGVPGGLEFWRFITFQFLHNDLMHVGFNMLGLYIFGGMVESYLGPRKYLAFYLTCGIFGGLMYLLLTLGGWLLPNFPLFLRFTSPATQLIGASAGVFGVIMACAKIAPNLQVQLLFPPIPMRLKVMAYLYVGLAIATILFNGKNAGGEAAHLGGAVAGAFFIRNSHLLRDFFDVFRDSRRNPQRPARRPATPTRPDLTHDQEVDRILAKVKGQGVQSLTDREKKILARDTEEKRARG